MPSLLSPSTATTVNDAAIEAAVSTQPLPPLTTTAIATVDDHHHHCYTVDNNKRQKPAVVVHCWWRQRQLSSTEAVVDGNHGNGGFCWLQLSSAEATVGWRDDDAMAFLTMASLADGGGGNGGHRHQLHSGSWCRRHHPFISVDRSGKNAIAAAAINHHFHQWRLLLLPLMATIVAAAQSMVNGGGGLCWWQQ
jgi:hypothetical protein